MCSLILQPLQPEESIDANWLLAAGEKVAETITASLEQLEKQQEATQTAKVNNIYIQCSPLYCPLL